MRAKRANATARTGKAIELLAAIRIRGKVKVRKEIEQTMRLLRLNRINHMVIVPEALRPMLKKAESFISFGEISMEILAGVLEKRARLEGDKKLNAGFLKEKKLKSFEELAKAILEGKLSLRQVGVKPVFRLNSPRKGHERRGIKQPFSAGGALGYRGEKINKLIERMM